MHLGRRVPDGHPLAEPGRRVGHAPDDLVVAEDPGQRGGRRPGQHAQDQLAAAQVRADLATDPGQHLGLDPEQDHVGALDRLDVARHRPDPVGREPGARAARRAGWLATIWSGWTRSPRRIPAIIASAITPEPTVAIVAFARGDIARSIAVRDGRSGPVRRPAATLSRRRRRPRNRSGRTARSSSPPRRGTRPRASAASSSVGLVVDLDDRELAAVVEPPDARRRPTAPGDPPRSTAGRGASR